MNHFTVSGKRILITGGTDGIGKQTAIELAKMGGKVVIVGRNPTKTELALAEIRTHSGYQADALLADLSTRDHVFKLAEDYRQKFQRLDILINNAGAIFMNRQVNADGLEMTFALNHMAYFILTNQLLDLLDESPTARIINVSSAAHQAAELDFDDLQNERSYSGWMAYSQSKLANLYFTYELTRRINSHSSITVNALHPGFVATNFGKSNGGLMENIFGLLQIGAISPQKGAETMIHLASSPAVEGITGKYFVKKQETKSSRISHEITPARQLWEISEALAGIRVSV